MNLCHIFEKHYRPGPALDHQPADAKALVSAVPQTQGLFWGGGPGSVYQSVQLYLLRGWGSWWFWCWVPKAAEQTGCHSQRGSSPSPLGRCCPRTERHDSWVLMPLKPACRPALQSGPIFLGGSFWERMSVVSWSPVPTGQGEGAGPEIPGGLMDAWTGPHPGGTGLQVAQAMV